MNLLIGDQTAREFDTRADVFGRQVRVEAAADLLKVMPGGDEIEDVGNHDPRPGHARLAVGDPRVHRDSWLHAVMVACPQLKRGASGCYLEVVTLDELEREYTALRTQAEAVRSYL